jgi:hypothetical protein
MEQRRRVGAEVVSERRVTRVCVLRSGGDFKPEHAQALARQVPGLVCLSDVPVPGVEVLPLRHSWPKWWAKMEAYGAAIQGDMLLLDLDTYVRRVPELPSVTTVLPDFYRPALMGSGFMYVTEQDRNCIWEAFIRSPAAHMQRCRTRTCWGDQGFLMPLIGDSPRWGANVVSWKVHCKGGIPPSADVVCFHGKPRPWEVLPWN